MTLARSRDLEEGWPCQRLRLGFGLLLFFFFEVTIGRKLPPAFAGVMLGLGVASLVSAASAIATWRQSAQLASILQALEQRP